MRETLARLSWPLQRPLVRLLYPAGTQPADFLLPAGEAALMASDSVSWRVFRNPVAMLVGGVAAVLLELAEPRVRTGVWEHTTFRERPLQRLQRTGYAAMMTVYGARSRTEAMIARINAGHARIAGHTPAGVAFRAMDVELLTWVQATATFGFAQAYALCGGTLSDADRDRFYAESLESARLYGVDSPPVSRAEMHQLFERMRPVLEPSEIVFEFLAIMQRMPMLPRLARPVQRWLVRASVQCLPEWARARLGLDGAAWRLADWQWRVVRGLGRFGNCLTLPGMPAILARERLQTARPGTPNVR